MERWQLKCGAIGVLEMVAPSGKSIPFMLRQERCMTGSYLAVRFRHTVKTKEIQGGKESLFSKQD